MLHADDPIFSRLRRDGAPEAAAKLARLAASEAAHSEAFSNFALQLQQVRDTERAAIGRLEAITRSPEYRTMIVRADDNHEWALTRARPREEEVAAVGERKRQIETAMAAEKAAITGLSARIADWLRRVPAATRLAPFKGRIPVPDGHDPASVVDQLRGKIVRLDRELEAGALRLIQPGSQKSGSGHLSKPPQAKARSTF